MTQKNVVIKLFYDKSDSMFYVQIGGTIFRVNDKIATRIQEKENLDIRYGLDITHIQQISREDEENAK